MITLKTGYLNIFSWNNALSYCIFILYVHTGVFLRERTSVSYGLGNVIVHLSVVASDIFCRWKKWNMMTLSNGNIFRVTGPLCGEFTGDRWIPHTRPVTRSFDVFFDLRLNKRLSKQSRGWWFETPSRSLLRHLMLPNVFSFSIDDKEPLPSHYLTPLINVTERNLFKLKVISSRNATERVVCTIASIWFRS